MPKNREGTWQRKGFSLGDESVEKLKDGSKYYGLNESNYVEFLIMQQAESLDPLKQLEVSNKEIKGTRELLREQEAKNTEISRGLHAYQEWLKKKRDKKPEALRVLIRKIQSKEYEDAERVAKSWSRMLGISPIQLLAEAMENNSNL